MPQITPREFAEITSALASKAKLPQPPKKELQKIAAKITPIMNDTDLSSINSPSDFTRLMQARPRQNPNHAVQVRDARREAHSRYESQLRQLKSRAESLETEKQNLEATLSSNYSEIQKLNAKISMMETSNQNLDSTVSRLNNQIRKMNDGTLETELNEKIKASEHDKTELRGKIKELEAELVGTQKKLEDKKRELSESSLTKEHLVEEKEKLQSEADKNARISGNFSREASSQVANAVAETQKLRLELAASNRKLHRAESKLAQVSKESARLASRVHPQSEQIQDLNTQLKKHSEVLKGVLRINMQLKEEGEQHKKEKAELSSNAKRLEATAAFHKKEADTLLAINTDLSWHNSNLSIENQTAQYNMRMIEYSDSMRITIGQLEDRLHQLALENSTLKEANQSMTSALVLNEELHRVETDTLRTMNQDLRIQNKGLSSEKDALHDYSQQLSSENQRLNYENQALQERVAALEATSYAFSHFEPIVYANSQEYSGQYTGIQAYPGLEHSETQQSLALEQQYLEAQQYSQFQQYPSSHAYSNKEYSEDQEYPGFQQYPDEYY